MIFAQVQNHSLHLQGWHHGYRRTQGAALEVGARTVAEGAVEMADDSAASHSRPRLRAVFRWLGTGTSAAAGMELLE